jgi:hypothetical protein
LEVGNVQFRKKKNESLVNNQIGNKKYPNWELIMRKLKIGNEKYPNWKLVMRKLEIGNGK